jgi:hypothetical protein
MSDNTVVDPVFDIDPSGINDPIYKALAARFDPLEHGTLPKAGGQTYVPWNLIANRLNIVLGVEHWSFHILREGFTPSECWVLGELTATIRDTVTVRQQYGLSPVTTDDVLKKAGTDALKKCAQVLGVALYLTDADERAEVKADMAAARRDANKPLPAPPNPPKPAGFFCLECHALVQSAGTVNVPKKTKDGSLVRVSVPVLDFAPVCDERLGGFHCPNCYEKKWFGAA